MQLFLDCDGVLADFDERATGICGMPPREFEDRYGERKFWDTIYAVPDFFRKMKPMADAHRLVNATRHLNPIILTGEPRGGWAAPQKLAWRDEVFPDLEMIVCPSAKKITFAKPGDVIVDDWPKWRHLWEEGGGIWVLHTSAEDSISQLQKLGVI